ncbi:hypothetical protein VC83_09235 [Pseudogymnoascus destructans]|uniref:N-acetyltransferase ESCO zinc-finger domain-containing protein n=2 Tax=Pseudogymnoascus destructans TaxID=655981 RepID=L8G0S3_PSED2|nr:uncharacterized protein VC83_09235 [Pseudogymnoascus destructans]ELR05541.1 hypothetical protein GMDG_07461 [Pseudogymnoascus destructans 20631-21]OAF54450.2 hypothetical protein VC83_09235 [Pseudogymnoascus destructans]
MNLCFITKIAATMGIGTTTMVSSVLGKRSRMRTYANRVRKDRADAPAKIVCIEVVNPLQDITNVLPVAPLPAPKSKRSITDYFAKPTASANPSSSDTNPSSDQPQEHIHSSTSSSSTTLPSSPSPLEPYHTGIKPQSRKRRRLTTRPRAIQATRPQTNKPDKMMSPEDYDGPVFSSDSDSSYSSSWEGSIVDGYTTAQDATTQGNLAKHPMATAIFRSNSFTSSPSKGPKETGRARSKTRAGGEGMVGEFSDMVYPIPANYSYLIMPPRASTTPTEGSKGLGRARSNTTAGRDAEKAYPIPAYSDSSSKTDVTLARPSNGGNEGGQKENTKPSKLVQTQINLGQNPITTCNVCKFTLNRTVVEDVKAHDKFHQAFVNLAEKLDMDEF